MIKLLTSITAALALAPLANAQCSKLAIQGGAAGAKMTVSVSGSTARAMTFLMVGQKAGKTSIKLGNLGTLNVALAQPFHPLPLGRTDAKGDLSRSFMIPKGAKKKTFLVQAISMGIKFPPLSLKFCESNVVKTVVGS